MPKEIIVRPFVLVQVCCCSRQLFVSTLFFIALIADNPFVVGPKTVLIHQLSGARTQAPFKKGKGRVEAVRFIYLFFSKKKIKKKIYLPNKDFVSSYETVFRVGIATCGARVQFGASEDV